MNNNEIAQKFGLTNKQITQAVEHYNATGQILNRAVAIAVGLVELH